MKNKFTKGMLVLIISFLAFQINAQTTNDGHNGNNPEKSPITNTYNDLNKGSKSVLFSDDFSDGISNWTTINGGAANWSGNDSDIAGGTAPEAFLNSTPVFEGYSTLMSPIINTTGETALALTLTQTLDNNVGDFSIKIQTTIDGGESWNTPWVKYVTDGDDYSNLENIIIENTHVGSENLQFAFRFKGVSDKMNGWYIDDVVLSGVTVLDVSPISLGGIYDDIYTGDPIVISSVVENLGYATVNFDVQLEVSDDDGIVFFSSKTVSDLASNEQISVDFDEWTALEGDYTATVTTLLGDDSNTENDVISDIFTVLSAVMVLDVSPISLEGIYDEINPEDPIVISSVVENLGEATVTFDVLLEVSDDDGNVFNSTKTVNDLAPTEQISVEFDEWTALEGDYTATVTTLLVDDSNTENDVISGTITVITAVSNMDKLNNIKIYPNPSQNYITLSNLDDVNIFIYDMSGTLINEYQHINNKITINTTNYTNGTYLVKVVSNNTVLTTKLNIVK